MKGQSKRFVNQQGEAYEVHKPKEKEDDTVSFVGLWRYATVSECVMTFAGVALSFAGALGVVAAIALYGELSSLFVQRHNAVATTPHAYLLKMFGGGEELPAGNRSAHMDALIHDSVAFALASLAVIAVNLLTAALAVYLSSTAAASMVTRLRWRLLRSVLRQDMAFFDTTTSLNFAATLTEDMEKFSTGVGEHVAMTAHLVGTVVWGATLSVVYGWQLSLLALAIVALAAAVAATVAKKLTRLSTDEVTSYGAAGRIVEEALSAIRTVRTYGAEEYEVQSYASRLSAAARVSSARGRWAGAGAGLGWLLTHALNAAVFAAGAELVVRDLHLAPQDQHYHPGVMLTVLFCSSIAAQNIAMCHPHLELFSAARGAAGSIFQLLEREPAIDAMAEGGRRPDHFRGDIEFENLYFNYPARSDVKVLRGLTLSVRAGETVALVGASGCGKSTLLQLLQRLYDPDSGAISVDGHPLHELNLHNFRSRIGVVGQEPVLFSGSVRDNITLGADDVSDDDVIAAAKTAHAHHFITKLPNGYSTVLSERGGQLSGGQRSRLALARALLRAPALLLLDEPTAALDPAAERQVQAALDAASKGRTTLVVSHRLSTIRNASRIVVVEQGSVREAGTHEELLALKGAYWQMCRDDLTTKSVESTQAEKEMEDELPAENFHRSTVRQSTTNSLMGSIRRSRRAGSLTARGHVGSLAPPAAELEIEEEEEDSIPPASTWQLLRLCRAERGLLVGGGVASFLLGASMPVFALLLSKLYGIFSLPEDEILPLARRYALLLGAAAILSGAGTFLQSWLFCSAGRRLTDRLRLDVFRNYLYQEQQWLEQPENAVGSLCARLAGDCAAVQGATGVRLGTVLQGVSTMALGAALAAAYSWKMTLVSLLSVPIVIAGISAEGAVTRRGAAAARRALEAAARVAAEAVAHARTVQALAMESTVLARYNAALQQSRLGAGKARVTRGLVYGICLCCPTLGYAVSLAYGGYLIATEDMNYEYAILVSEALIYGAWMLAEALSFAPSFTSARRAGSRVLSALARQPAVTSPEGADDDPNWKPRGDVEFRDVVFSYGAGGGAGGAVLRGLRLSAGAGRTLAVVGASGGGKSTVLRLIARDYDPQGGAVLLDGRDIRSLPLRSLRGALALVPQEPALFSRSLRDNIAYARDAPLEDIIQAAKDANVHSFVSALPHGYDTVVGPSGLSGGQRQRVCVARALLRDPAVLLLDEPTSALDAASEKVVSSALARAARGRTTLLVAHRLATVRHADTIAVLHTGEVAEMGSHEELVKKRGLYWELLQHQAPTS